MKYEQWSFGDDLRVCRGSGRNYGLSMGAISIKLQMRGPILGESGHVLLVGGLWKSSLALMAHTS
jgi:hypothetical protein